MPDERERRLAEAVRQACIRALREGYDTAGISGLCAEGALEAALSAMQRLDLDEVVEEARGTEQ
jgi:hypothetical protein